MTSKSAVAVKIPVEAKKEQKKDDPGAQAALRADLGARYFFFSSRFLKTREKCISFAMFLREVGLLFNFCMIKFTIFFTL